MSQQRLLLWRVRKGRDCVECWVALTEDGFTVTFEGGVWFGAQTFSGWSGARQLIAERRARYVEQGWEPEDAW